jgi:FkbM family methyltransferase
MIDWRRKAREGVRLSRKVGALVREKTYRKGLRRGVAAAIEHREAFFEHEFRTVVDAGAGRGQFALFALRRFPLAHIHSFEPLPASRGRLARVASESNRVTVRDLALGAAAGAQELHISAARDSSSLLSITEKQTSAYPGTESVGRIGVVIAPLDEALPAEALAGPRG